MNWGALLSWSRPAAWRAASLWAARMSTVDAARGSLRDNIATFGGDPNAVTVAGQSAGAHTVHPARILLPPMRENGWKETGSSGTPTFTRAPPVFSRPR
nr:carboxylesterase family protein [Streptomyces himalayensis]